jgi:hypothetical protein
MERGAEALSGALSLQASCHRPARPGDPVRRDISFGTNASGILDHPLSRMMTIEFDRKV